MASSSEAVKLPSPIFEDYKQYKVSTATVLQWLSENGALTPQSNLTTKELQSAVERVRNNSVQVPEAVYRAFKDSIAKRRKVSEWFSSAELKTGGKTTGSTASHIYYTEKLQAAFSTLFQGRKEDMSHGLLSGINPSKEAILSQNRFEVLEGAEYDVDEPFTIEPHKGVSLEISQHIHNTHPPNCVLQDDPLEKLIEIYLLLRELDSICDTVKGFWEQASEGTLPLPFAAWLTNAAYNCATDLCVAVIDIDKDAQEHQEVYIGVVNELNIVFASDPTDSKYDDFRQGRGMTFPWIAIMWFKTAWNQTRDLLPKNGWQDPIKHISPTYKHDEDDDGEKFRKDLRAYKSLLTSIGELSLKENDHNRDTSFTPSDMNPLLSDLSIFLNSGDDSPSLHLVFGVHLLLEVFKSFIWKNETATTTNCRLQALRFAKDVKELVQMPALPTCDAMVAILRAVDAARLDEYLVEKRFDLYFQSPWTAGYHMCEILHHSMDTGLRFCNSKGHVGAVLHVYNALRQLGFIPAVTLLDDLCEVFTREIFLGSLPTTNFSSNFRRFLGGTSQLDAGSTSADARQGRRAIGLPATFPTARDYAKRLMPSEMSLFYELHNQRFTRTMDFCSRLCKGKPASSLSKKQRDDVIEDLNAISYVGLLQKMKTVVLREFIGKAPVASIQYHAIHALCLQILTEMAFLKFEEDGRDATTASTEAGFVFVDTLLVTIVEHQRDTQKSKILPYLTSLRLVRRALLKFCSGRQLADFIWKF